MKIVRLNMFRNKRSLSVYSLARRAIAAILVAAFTIGSTASAAGAPVAPQAGMEKGPMTGTRLKAADQKAYLSNWENLRQLTSGQQIKVVLNDAKSFQGKFQSVSDEALVLRLATGEQTFNRQSVLKVSSQGQGHRGRNTLIGLAVGAGAGLAIGEAYSASIKKEWPRNRWGTLLIAPGALVGTLVGAVVPTSGGWRDLYRAR